MLLRVQKIVELCLKKNPKGSFVNVEVIFKKPADYFWLKMKNLLQKVQNSKFMFFFHFPHSPKIPKFQKCRFLKSKLSSLHVEGSSGNTTAKIVPQNPNKSWWMKLVQKCPKYFSLRVERTFDKPANRFPLNIREFSEKLWKNSKTTQVYIFYLPKILFWTLWK